MAEYFEKGFSTVTGDGTVVTPAYTQRCLRWSVLNAVEFCVIADSFLQLILLINA